MTTPTAAPELDLATERSLAVGLFNHVWTLLATTDRSPAQVDEMIHAAHASRYHWGRVGEAVNRARGEWQCARVYSVLARGEPALWHARRCLAILEEAGVGDWDLAAGCEAMARACLAAGDRAGCAEWKARAIAALDGITDPEDRGQIEGDLATLP